MLPTCLISDLKIFKPNDYTRKLAGELSCPPLAAGVLEMLKGTEDIDTLREWIHPDFTRLIESLDLGKSSKAAKSLWESKSSFGNVLVYGDYDTDGISSTVLAMEIFRNKAAQVRYFIPRRDRNPRQDSGIRLQHSHCYGLRNERLRDVTEISRQRHKYFRFRSSFTLSPDNNSDNRKSLH